MSLLSSGLKRKGHNVQSFQYYPDNFFTHRLDDVGIDQHIVLKKNKIGANVIRKLTQLYNQEQYDVVLAYMDTPNLYAVIASKLAKHKAVVAISHRNSTDIQALSPIVRRIRYWSNTNADIVICNSHHERDNWLIAQPEIQACTIYNGIYDILDGNPVELNSCPGDFIDCRPELKTLLCVGTVTQRKNAETIVLAMSILKKSNKLNFKLVWVGEPKANLEEDTQYFKKTQKMINSHDLNSYWIWAGQRKNVIDFYQYADALIHASVQEGLPNVICEAQMAGLPVFASDVLDHGKMIDSGNTGFCFNHINTEELAEMLHSFFQLTNKERLKFREKSRVSALKLFSLDRCIGEYESTFAKAILTKP